MSDNKFVLVTGATGGQGGAVARSLLDRGWPVRALVRDPDKPAAKDLAALGAQLHVGDLDDPHALRAAAQQAYGVFSVQPDFPADPQPETEVRRGRNVADAAASAGVAHLVYSSVVFTRADGIPTRFERLPIERLRAQAEQLAIMFTWLNEHGFRADIAALRRQYPRLLTLETWLGTAVIRPGRGR